MHGLPYAGPIFVQMLIYSAANDLEGDVRLATLRACMHAQNTTL